MLHAKFQDPKPLGSGKVFAIYDYMGVAAILVM